MKAGREKSKQIQSPNFSQKHANKLDCLWMFVGNGNLLLSARVNIKVVGTAGSRDQLIIQKSLEVSRSDSQVHEYYGKSKRNKALTFRNTPGSTIKFVSDRGNRGKSIFSKCFCSCTRYLLYSINLHYRHNTSFV